MFPAEAKEEGAYKQESAEERFTTTLPIVTNESTRKNAALMLISHSL